MSGDREFLQSLIDVGGRITIPSVNPATGESLYIIDAPLVLRSHCNVIIDNCTLRMADGVCANMFISEGAWDPDPAPLEHICIQGCGHATLDGGNYNGLSERTAHCDGRPSVLHNSLILFRNVTRFTLYKLNMVRARYWNAALYYCDHGMIMDIRFQADSLIPGTEGYVPNQDGIDLRVGCHDVEMYNLRGSTGDDTVALTGILSPHEQMMLIPALSPDIYNIEIQYIRTEVADHNGLVRVLCHDGVRIHDVEICVVYDSAIDVGRKRSAPAVRLGDRSYWTVRPAEPGDMANITVMGVVTNVHDALSVHGEIPGLVTEGHLNGRTLFTS